jgi:hypothetical protein
LKGVKLIVYVFENCKILGPYIRSKDGRSIIYISFSNKTHIVMTYARYLMCIKENRILKKEEIVDHKDENKFNDNINNLQILTNSENVYKNNVARFNIGLTYVIYICPVCNFINILKLKKFNYNSENGTKHPICNSKRCAGIISGQNRRGEQPFNLVTLNSFIEINGFYFDKYILGYFIK